MKKLTTLLLGAAMFGLFAGAASAGDHHKNLNFDCQTCHETKTPTYAPTDKACIQCHGPLEQLVEKTKQPKDPLYLELNPHKSHHYGEKGITCFACHSEHKEGKLYCSNCHKDISYKNFKP